MTVAELIERLREMPQDAPVVMGSCCYPTFDVTGCVVENAVLVERDGEYQDVPVAVFFSDSENDPGHWGH